MITGTHILLYTSEVDAVRTLLADAFGFKSVDAGEGWLIFALPPAEMGVHPADPAPKPLHEVSFMCDDLEATMADLRAKGVEFDGEPQDAGWGINIYMVLPGDLRVMLYQPRHATAI